VPRKEGRKGKGAFAVPPPTKSSRKVAAERTSYPFPERRGEGREIFSPRAALASPPVKTQLLVSLQEGEASQKVDWKRALTTSPPSLVCTGKRKKKGRTCQLLSHFQRGGEFANSSRQRMKGTNGRKGKRKNPSSEERPRAFPEKATLSPFPVKQKGR